MEKIIVVNSGSVSSKYGLFEKDNPLALFHYEHKDGEYFLNIKIGKNISIENNIDKNIFEKSFEHFLNTSVEKKILVNKEEISLVAFRVVAPGLFFTENYIIDENYLKKIQSVKKYSIIHISNLQKEIDSVRKSLPKIKMVAISDSAFHKDQDPAYRNYSLPRELVNKYELYRYGYHGLSVESVLKAYKEEVKNELPEKVVVCHLGGGTSVTSLKKGKSIYNSMGYSPLSGITMSTRVGDIDPEVLFILGEGEKYDFDELRDLVGKKSGLLGFSGISSDIRVLMNNFDSDSNAQNAILNYVYSIKKHIGIAISLLNGIDLLIFTGTIADRSSKMRELITENFDYFGIEIDKNKNNLYKDKNLFINIPGSKTSVYLCHTEEMRMVARKALYFLI